MGFVEAVKIDLSKYATFSGRATRPEYWYFVLFFALCNIVCSLADTVLGTRIAGNGLLSLALTLALIVPHCAVAIRRLHDVDRSGWWYGGLIAMIFIASFSMVLMTMLGVILALVAFAMMLGILFWFCSAGTPGPNRYGPPPPAVNLPIASE